MENGISGYQQQQDQGGADCAGCGVCAGCVGWLAGSGAGRLLADLRGHLCRTRPLRPLPSALAFLSQRADAADAATAPLRRHTSSFSIPAASSFSLPPPPHHQHHPREAAADGHQDDAERPAKLQKHNHTGETSDESAERASGSIHFEGFDTVNFDTALTETDQSGSSMPDAMASTTTSPSPMSQPLPQTFSYKRRASIALPNPIPLTSEEQAGRRKAIFGESVEPGPLDVATLSHPSYPKSPETQRALEQALKTNVMFSHLDKDDRSELFDAMFEVRYSPGDIIIRQGDEGDNFYVVESGTCEVWKTSEGNPMPDMVLTIGEGGSFGELSLIFGTQRAATVKARTDVVLWAIHRTTYRRVLMGATLRKRSLYESFLKNVPILAPLERYERLMVADALEAETFEDGTAIITEGEVGDAFYIIVEGQVKVTQNNEEVARLGESAYFGEIALLTNQPRRATVVAVGSVKCAKISREKFFRVMGPCQDVLKRNVEIMYPQYAAQLL